MVCRLAIEGLDPPRASSEGAWKLKMVAEGTVKTGFLSVSSMQAKGFRVNGLYTCIFDTSKNDRFSNQICFFLIGHGYKK